MESVPTITTADTCRFSQNQYPIVMEDNDLLLHQICSDERGIRPETLETIIVIAVEIAREGREGRKVGTMFIVGDSTETLRRSRCLILDPLLGHPDADKRIDSGDMRETIKELAQLDGAFIISEDGVALSAARYIDSSSAGINLPLGLGSRHMAGASISLHTSAVAVVVSESSVVRVFDDGEIVSEIIPELWLLQSKGLDGAYTSRNADRMRVVDPEE